MMVMNSTESIHMVHLIDTLRTSADGSAIYCTMLLAKRAYGTTSIQGLGLEHIFKQRGSGGTSDPLNQFSTQGWKMTKAAVRLVEEYMVRVEHSTASMGLTAESN
jgi:N4-gp56 family major capsid protein